MQQYPDHYSHSFKLDISKLPTREVDRFSRLVLILSALCGAMLCLIGFYQIFHFSLDGVADLESNLPRTHIKIHTFVPPIVFNSLLLVLGFGLILNAFIRMLRYKIIFFDGDTIMVKNQPLFSKSYGFSEHLYNYSGVRLRVKFYQYGLFNKNKFIIELYHKDPAKTIPLYISTSKHHIRKIWKEYAQILRMPALTIQSAAWCRTILTTSTARIPKLLPNGTCPKILLTGRKNHHTSALKAAKAVKK